MLPMPSSIALLACMRVIIFIMLQGNLQNSLLKQPHCHVLAAPPEDLSGMPIRMVSLSCRISLPSSLPWLLPLTSCKVAALDLRVHLQYISIAMHAGRLLVIAITVQCADMAASKSKSQSVTIFIFILHDMKCAATYLTAQA